MDLYEKHIEELRSYWKGKEIYIGKKKGKVINVNFDGLLVIAFETKRKKRHVIEAVPEYVQVISEKEGEADV